MKSESSPTPVSTLATVADAFEAFFDLIDAPAALCDTSLVILRANAAFEVLCGRKPLTNAPLGEVLASAPVEVPNDGVTTTSEVELKSGQRVSLSVSRRGHTVAVFARSQAPDVDSLTAAGRALIEHSRVESQLLDIGRNVAGAASEEDLVATVAKGVKGLFPGRTFAVRITDPRTCALTSLYAEGRMNEGVRDVVHLRRSMVEKTHLNLHGLPSDKVVVTGGELPRIFQDSVRGIAAPLVASGQLFGVVNVEYPKGLAADVVADERVLIQLANTVAVAVRNAKLIDELTFVRKYLEELLENANALILVVNKEWKVVVFNRALAKLTGVSKGDVLGRELLSIVPETGHFKMRRMFSGPMKGEPGESFETELTTPGGRAARATFAISPVMSQTGEVEGVIAIGQDLTKVRELETRVIQAEKLASLGQLAASVVHEINNPMTAVITYADALLQRAMANPAADGGDAMKFRRIVDNSERVLRFTRDLVSYARPANDKPEAIDLAETIDRAAGYCEHVVARHGLRLERELAELPKFLAVRQNLIQVFVNLITNACHATPSGGVIRIALTREGDTAVVVVSDTGSGMAPDVQKRIFEPFFTTKVDGKGTGLGLSIVQGIVENHGGTISVASEAAHGTRFTIRLPMVDTPA
ncbi:MAG: PAS domain S-box protein [Archangium sp.]|nr:PAS domain S-box protein [Archangium sp.]